MTYDPLTDAEIEEIRGSAWEGDDSHLLPIEDFFRLLATVDALKAEVASMRQDRHDLLWFASRGAPD